jgi:hypothetical protein
MLPSATLRQTAVERISCLDALRWRSAPTPSISLAALLVTPQRPYRVEPRAKKRRPQNFPFMIKPRQVLRQPLI